MPGRESQRDVAAADKMCGNPLVSVVIATFNRCRILKVTLEKLSLQSLSPGDYEVLVVDDGSIDDTSGMVKSLVPSLPYRLRYCYHGNRGPGYTQNRGIRASQGRVVLLLADDIWAAPTLLESHIGTHEKHPEENVAVLGKVMQSPDLPPTLMHRYWDPFKFYLLNDRQDLEGIYFLACNISVKKSFLLCNGLFRERTGAAHEDLELGYRLGERGLIIRYNQNALAYHYHEETLAGACRRAYERGYNLDMLTNHVPKNVVYNLYRNLTVEAGMKIFIKNLPRELLLRCFFNRWAVRAFWLPLLNLAEKNRAAAIFANAITYRCVVGSFVREGHRDKRRNRRSSLETRM